MNIRLLFGCVIGLMIMGGATYGAENLVEPISLPEGLLLDVNPAAQEKPASAEEPSNARSATAHPLEILRSLQESVEQLSAAGLTEEAVDASRLLQKFEEKHLARLVLELQSARSSTYRSEIDRLQRRLSTFDIDEAEQRRRRAWELREYEVKLTNVHYRVHDDGRDNIVPLGERSLNEIAPPPRIEHKNYEKTVHLIDDITAARSRLDSTNWEKDEFPVRR